MAYTQLTQEQRYQIYALLKMEHSQTKVATVIGVHKSTISREVHRNCGKRGYRPKQAHCLSLKRRRNTVTKRITAETWARIDEKLQQDWSPEQVSGWLKKNTEVEVSHEWIYQHIYMDKRSGGDLYKHLRCQKKRRKRIGDYDRRGKIPNQVSIEDRPEIVEKRERIGDWEGDTIIGAGRQGAIVTLVERKSRFTLLKQVANRTAAVVEDAILDLLKPYQVATHTITFDNGKEFANHQSISEKLKSDVYFAHPYASWERGTNENTNGLIRQYFPKGSDFSSFSDRQISFVMERLNARPRKCLDFQAPAMVFSQTSPGCT
ncbi:MAG: IS30 family transposase [Desulfobulbaceae bacterium]|nr:IS30 family transposase [Desulfobulbaceae bacterium]